MQSRTERNRRKAAGHRKTEAWHPPAMGVPEKAAHPSGLASWQRPCGPVSRHRLAVARGNPRGLPMRRFPTWLWPVSCSLWVWVSLASPTTPHLPGGEAGRIQVREPRHPQASRSRDGPGLMAQGQRRSGSRLMGFPRHHEKLLGPSFPSLSTHFRDWETEAAGVLGGAVPPKAASISPL